MKHAPFPFLLLPLLLLATPGHAADRIVPVTSFDRIRVEGPFEVHVATRGTPAARIAGSRAATDGVEVRVDGTTLIVRAGGQEWSDRTKAGAHDAPIVTLRTSSIRAVTVMAGGTLDIFGPVRGDRIDLEVSGSGAVTVPAIDAQQLNVTVIGAGTAALGGRAANARLISDGAATIEATPLQVDTLLVRLDGPGTTHASARYTADVATSGLGAATVYGKPKCKVRAAAGGPIDCGVPLPVK